MIEPAIIWDKLLAAGIKADAQSLAVDSRNGRTVAILDDDRVAWFPESAEGRTSIDKDRRILRLVERYCSYRAPRILYEDKEGWDVRAMVKGVAAPDFLHLVRTDADASERLGTSIGVMLAEQHTRIPQFLVSDWLSRVPPWPAPCDLERVSDVVVDKILLRRIARALNLRDEIAQDLADPVLVHGDLGPWNLACNPKTGDVNGVFDYGDASLSDRHQDFKYLQFQKPEEQSMLEAAIRAYQEGSGVQLNRRHIHFFNAIDAIGFLGNRFGHAPEDPWCGRTLAEDLAWTDAALASVGL